MTTTVDTHTGEKKIVSSRAGAIGGLVAAAAFIFGIALLVTSLSDYTNGDATPAESVEFLVGNQSTLFVWYLVIYLVFGVAIIGGITLIAAPSIVQMARSLDGERLDRIRSDERARISAHLHDSVLQTLALIQRHSDDPQTMLNLARRQERELRNWLDPGRASREGGSVRGQLDELASEVEGMHRVPVEIVSVGDCLVDGEIETLLAATREAAMNAAEHSGAEQVDIYAEVSQDLVEFFVRDAGWGFDPADIPSDRHGVRQSIRGRMERLGGTVELHSNIGEGTEVELTLQRANKEKR